MELHVHNLVGKSATPLQGHLPVRLDMDEEG